MSDLSQKGRGLWLSEIEIGRVQETLKIPGMASLVQLSRNFDGDIKGGQLSLFEGCIRLHHGSQI